MFKCPSLLRLRAAIVMVLAVPLTSAISIAESGLPVVRIAKFPGNRAAAISYTFDDGLRDQYTVAVPMLNEVGFKGTFFIIAGRTAGTPQEGEKKQSDSKARNRWGGISWPELKEMADQGHEIASHTWSHPDMTKLTPGEADAEFGKAFEMIKARIGKPPLTVAFPFNQSTPEVEAIARKYHIACRTFQLGASEKSTVASLNRWADQLIEERKRGVLMAHAISDGYAQFSDPEILRTHLKYVRSRGVDICVDTFANIALYEKERDESSLGVIGKSGKLICQLTSNLDPVIYNMPLTLVIDTVDATEARAKRAGSELPVRMTKNAIEIDAVPSEHAITVEWK